MAESAPPPTAFGSFHVRRGALLGSGTYGQVCKAMLNGLTCAAKLLNDILLDLGSARNRTWFQLECRLLKEIRHPNIVQYLGMAEDEELGLPLLLMELMDDSLTHFLEQSEESLAYHVQVNISHDITLAVAFLHTNGIIHRDLSSNNVLVIGPGSRAKVTDFWMSTLTELNSHMTGLTKCPGNPAYMSPEALLDPPVYTEKLDCFQVGVLMLQIMTRKYPVPGRAMNQVQDTKSLTSWEIDPITELQRRYNHLSLVAETHPMLRITKDCLKDTDSERPSAQQICRYLSALKENPQYVQSLEGKRGEREGGDSVEEGGEEGHEMEGKAQERKELSQQLSKENQVKKRENWEDREVKEEREVENIQIETQLKETGNKALRSMVGEEGNVKERETVNKALRSMVGEEGNVKERETGNKALRSMVGEEGNVKERETGNKVLRSMVGEEGNVKERETGNKALRSMVGEEENVKEREVENLQYVIQVKEEENKTLRKVVGEKEEEVREKEREAENLRDVVHVKERDIETIRTVIQEREKDVRFKIETIKQLHQLVHDKDHTIDQLHQHASSFNCLVSGPGLHSATANHLTCVVVELSDFSGKPCSLIQNVTAGLISLSTSSQATPTSDSQWLLSKTPSPSTSLLPPLKAAVTVISPSKYDVSYTAVRRGPHKLHIEVNGSEINGSPFTLMVYPDPAQLGSPMRIVKQLNKPYGIAFNSRGEMIVSECAENQVSVFDVGEQKVRSFGSRGDRPEQMILPAGVAVDDTDNIYVSSKYKVQKFTSSGELIKCIGRTGSKIDPRGVTIHSNQVYICDRNNNCLHVFDLDLNFIHSISPHGKGRRKLVHPLDVAFDAAGNMYIVDFGNDRVQVMDSSGKFIRMLSQEGEGKLSSPTALHIVDKYVYVSDLKNHRIAVYETSGQYVTSFGRCGTGKEELSSPYCITSWVNGCIYVCDLNISQVQVF